MSLFGTIMSKIFGRKTPESASAGAEDGGGIAQQQTMAPAPTQSVDVGAVLGEMAVGKDGGGNYKSSIVDLLKLLDLDSSLAARKELGEELGVNAGEDGSAEQNIALHKAVMDKLAANGGVVPDDLRN